jgi:hypothetical protein
LMQDFTDNPVLLLAAIDRIALGLPTTNLYGSIIDALDKWDEVFIVNAPSTFESGDEILLLSDLVTKLNPPSDEVSIYINSTLSASTLQQLADYVDGVSDPFVMKISLIEDLNSLLEGPSIYEAQRFEGVTLRPETRVLLDVSPEGRDLIRLNRLLLEDAYPLELERKKVNSIESGYLIVLTDGSDQSGLATLQQVLNKRNSEEKKIFSVGLGNEIDPVVLAQIGNAGYTGVNQAADLAAAFTQIQKTIEDTANSFYWLNYASPKRGDFIRTLSVALKGNLNTAPGSVLFTQFNSNGFSSILPAVTINRSVYKPNGIRFLNMTSLEPYPMRALTILAFNTPNYLWSVTDPNLVELIPHEGNPMEVSLLPKANGVTSLTLIDSAHAHQVQIPLRIEVEELIGLGGLILTSPSSQTLVEGSRAILSGEVNEDVPGTVSWEYRPADGNWSTVEGVLTAFLMFDPVLRNHSGEYRIVYQTADETSYSDPATLSVFYETISVNAQGEIALAFVADEETVIIIEQSNDLTTWIPSIPTPVRDGDILRMVIAPTGEQLFFRASYSEEIP